MKPTPVCTKHATTKIWWERKLDRINHLLKCLWKTKTSTELFCKKECKTCFFILVLSVKHRFSFCSSLSVCPISTMLPGQKGIKDRSSQKKKRVSTCGKTSSFHKKCLISALPLYFVKSTWWNRVKYVCFFTIWNWWWSKWFLGVSYQGNSSESRYGTLCGFFCSYLSPIFSELTRGLTNEIRK